MERERDRQKGKETERVRLRGKIRVEKVGRKREEDMDKEGK